MRKIKFLNLLFFLLILILSSCGQKNHDLCDPNLNENSVKLMSENKVKRVRGRNLEGESIILYTEKLEDGDYQLEGDIRLSKNDVIEINTDPDDSDNNEPHIHSVTNTNKDHLWSNNTVPFVISDGFNTDSRNKILKAIELFNNDLVGSVQFQPRTNESQYIEFTSTNGNWSYVGRVFPEVQLIGLYRNNFSLGTVLHEMGHAVGLWHEQSRTDRDHYVKILWCNIEKSKRYNFFRNNLNSINRGPYDFKSIMHYTRSSFAISPFLTTIESIVSQSKVPSNDNFPFSEGDINGIRALYP